MVCGSLGYIGLALGRVKGALAVEGWTAWALRVRECTSTVMAGLGHG